MQQENKEECIGGVCPVSLYGGRLIHCTDCPLAKTNNDLSAPQTPDSWENFNPLLFQDFLDETTHYHTNIKKLKDFIRTQLTLAHSSGRREGIQYATKRINEHNKDMLKMWEDFWKSLEQ